MELQTKDNVIVETDWLLKEIELMEENKANNYEKLESLKMEENKVTEFEVDFSKPFNKWIDKETGKIKKIIPVVHLGVRKLWWLNPANPIYKEVMLLGKGGTKRFKVLRTGKEKNTKYIMVK
jgi:hypothetical protein